MQNKPVTPNTLEWRLVTISQASKELEPPDRALLVAVKGDTACLENDLAVSYTLNHIVTTQTSNSTLGVDPWE